MICQVAENKKILRLVKKGFIPGRELARRLNLSRHRIGRIIRELIDEGFPIEARPGRGYRLRKMPDRLLPSLIHLRLGRGRIGRRIYYSPTTDSTNERALRLASLGAPEGTVVITEHQKSGRGRSGRCWVSPRGKGLLLSIIFRPRLKPHELFRLSMLASIAAVNAIYATTGLKSTIKWPNDIYLNGRKVGGILMELFPGRGPHPTAVLGIGINVNFDPSLYPEIGNMATSLSKELGREASRLELAVAFLKEVNRGYRALKMGKFNAIFHKWRGNLMGLGSRAQVRTAEGLIRGRAEDVDETGALILRDERKGRRLILTEDVSWELRPIGSEQWPVLSNKTGR